MASSSLHQSHPTPVHGDASSVALRPASVAIADVAARLLYLTMRPLTEYWLGVDDMAAAHAALRRLFASRGNLFSFEFAEYAELQGNVAGLLLAYPAPIMKALELPTVLQYFRAAGIWVGLRMLWRSFPLQSIAQAAPHEYFLAHIAVLPEYEGRGLGQRMLVRVQERATQAGFKRITLTVDAKNDRAISLYKRAGYRVSATIDVKPLRRRFQYHGYYHMAKDLA